MWRCRGHSFNNYFAFAFCSLFSFQKGGSS
nr:MAG TPA: hypothetical protein [Caudoviricetes sp.]